ncbi:hypothetical protein CR513_42793, partial [Mucuna pruriens]
MGFSQGCNGDKFEVFIGLQAKHLNLVPLVLGFFTLVCLTTYLVINLFYLPYIHLVIYPTLLLSMVPKPNPKIGITHPFPSLTVDSILYTLLHYKNIVWDKGLVLDASLMAFIISLLHLKYVLLEIPLSRYMFSWYILIFLNFRKVSKYDDSNLKIEKEKTIEKVKNMGRDTQTQFERAQFDC